METINPKVSAFVRAAKEDPDRFWAQAATALPWHRRWDRVLDWDPEHPDDRGRYFRWFVGGETSLAANAVDRHVDAGDGGRADLECEDEHGGRTVLTYAQLSHEVRITAQALRGLGIRKGDRVGIYMPTCREAIVLMLACVRIGAIHIAVFAGFGSGALGDRLEMAGATALFCSDITYRKGKDVPLKGIVDEALGDRAKHVRNVVLHRRSAEAPAMTAGRDVYWEDFLALGAGQSDEVEWLESNEPAYILATSGTTAKPKLAIHTHGGYQVYIASMGKWCFGLNENDVWWATSDIGWIVGHSYMIYAPLVAGATTVVFEGALDHPAPDANWRVVVEEYGATGIFTSPTAVRMLMKYGDEPLLSVDHSTLERVVCAGEVLNAPAWDWLQNTIHKGSAPVIDHMWQTETGGPAFGNPYGIDLLPIKPGSATIPLPGIDAAVVTMDGTPCGPNEKGIMTIRRPFPGLTPALLG